MLLLLVAEVISWIDVVVLDMMDVVVMMMMIMEGGLISKMADYDGWPTYREEESIPN